jgi:hypothetical protein
MKTRKSKLLRTKICNNKGSSVTPMEKQELKIIKIRNVRQDIITDLTEVKLIIRECQIFFKK